MIPKIIKLKNGATLIYKREKINNAVALGWFYNVGAGNSEYKPGILHFGEHLRAKQTKEMSIEECDKFSKTNAIYTNAFTSLENLTFVSISSRKKVNDAAKIISEKMFNDRISDELYDKERKVILNEIERSKDDDDKQHALLSLQTIYKNDLYKADVLGHNNEILNYSQDEVQEHISKVINSNNLVAVVTGNISKWHAKKLVNEHVLSKIETSTPTIESMNQLREFNEKSKLVIKYNDLNASIVTISFPVHLKGKKPFYKHYRAFRPYILDSFNNIDGLLNKVLRRQNGLVYYANASFTNAVNNALFTIKYKINTNNINKSLELLSEAIKNLQITEKEFKEIKALHKLNEDLKNPDNFGFDNLSILYQTYKINGKFYSNRLWKKAYKQQTVEHINSVINDTFKNNKIYVTISGKVKEEDVYPIKTIEKMFFTSFTPKHKKEKTTKQTKKSSTKSKTKTKKSS